jgi:hypothetical protein
MRAQFRTWSCLSASWVGLPAISWNSKTQLIRSCSWNLETLTPPISRSNRIKLSCRLTRPSKSKSNIRRQPLTKWKAATLYSRTLRLASGNSTLKAKVSCPLSWSPSLSRQQSATVPHQCSSSRTHSKTPLRFRSVLSPKTPRSSACF